MKRLLNVLLVLGALACSSGVPVPQQPSDRLYFPSGLKFEPSDGGGLGRLYVASTNFDKRYASGLLTALDLNAIRDGNDGGLAPITDPAPATPQILENLNVAKGATIGIDSLAGDMDGFFYNGALRLFIPSRNDNDAVNVVDARGGQLSCAKPVKGQESFCGADTSLWLSKHRHDGSTTGLPAAPQPFGVTVAPRYGAVNGGDADVYVTHLQPPDSPPGSELNYTAYVVHLDGANPVASDDRFIQTNPGGESSVAAGARFLYVSGRYTNIYYNNQEIVLDNVLRVLDRSSNGSLSGDPRYVYAPCGLQSAPCVQLSYAAQEARSLVLSPDEKYLYLVTRNPDALVVFTITPLVSGDSFVNGLPKLSLIRAIPLPSAPDEMVLLPRAPSSFPGITGNLLAITCSGANSLILYDDGPGTIVSQVLGAGLSPGTLAVDVEGDSARLYINSFLDGRLAVVDVPNLGTPSNAFVRAYIGKSQTCIIRDQDPSCQGYVP